jgi:hypothetical protein
MLSMSTPVDNPVGRVHRRDRLGGLLRDYTLAREQ